MLARAAAAAVGPRAGGAGSRTATHAWNGRSTAPFAAECQSEVDETFVGGLAKNKHKDKRGKGGGTGGVGSGKTPIVGAVKRKGNVIARVIENVRADTLCDFVREAVSHKVSLLSAPTNGRVTGSLTRNIRTRPLTTPRANMSSARFILKQSKASGPSSSAA